MDIVVDTDILSTLVKVNNLNSDSVRSISDP